MPLVLCFGRIREKLSAAWAIALINSPAMPLTFTATHDIGSEVRYEAEHSHVLVS